MDPKLQMQVMWGMGGRCGQSGHILITHKMYFNVYYVLLLSLLVDFIDHRIILTKLLTHFRFSPDWLYSNACILSLNSLFSVQLIETQLLKSILCLLKYFFYLGKLLSDSRSNGEKWAFQRFLYADLVYRQNCFYCFLLFLLCFLLFII